ncbi:cysteine--1-D-myo-inosityl 2-amino-2-deoxy-alpha-D-glucopyranoside ligase [Isoptericola sp. b441]|uniref:L-cysteine:1D-myo-inositol 2-amino-2-deoxy-alpha-D-glucopyranoside ligase n=1 Tax=Actinotalea lenta TaxID=3064654 RepID=A0ABT9D9I9_9CELL|nr:MULTISPECIES: cysteine--1-D-myo-inosityl 2-amino-2-deoxy-alpha-D-glucopyranoside ligase [unclassified Isoptericola]MDO8107551.1 cysteine--1-D-myo-inosityl 2-amino-2-deoxy-alpha-D-glucopyranoside ligase [Isoptericola sp. b441]MDO8120789.1 cysteine--1-D-myo-inosityl 2-amino-2-deoxy-alpha-D-glucopyranoside ligase [Isoptericola sp. b490]
MQTWPAPSVPQIPGRGPEVRVRGLDGVLVPAATGDVAGLYVCGITPYDATHLGHAATAVAFDLLHRAWLDQGLTVKYVSNVTDVDDPLLERATALGVDWTELAAEQTALYAQDMAALAVLPPDVYLGAVEAIGLIVDAVTRLLDRGLAYRVPLEEGAGGDRPDLGDVYADSHAQGVQDLARMETAAAVTLFAERGGDPDRAGKRHPLDPALWRRERPGEPAWDGGVLGSGRPGWHIECTAIAERALGGAFDVQGGGSDLCFPHHAMSTAHARALGGQGARVQLHAGMVGLAGEKMSKSLGNLVLVSALRERGVDPMAVRLAILAHHYREDWEWSDEVLATATRRLERWRAAVSGNGGPGASEALAEIRSALADDLDAPRALAAVDSWADASLTLGGDDEGAPGVVSRAVDALLGVRL